MPKAPMATPKNPRSVWQTKAQIANRKTGTIVERFPRERPKRMLVYWV